MLTELTMLVALVTLPKMFVTGDHRRQKIWAEGWSSVVHAAAAKDAGAEVLRVLRRRNAKIETIAQGHVDDAPPRSTPAPTAHRAWR